MFQLSVVEHIRLSFGSAIAAYQGHADATWRLTRWSLYAKTTALVLAAGAMVCSVAALLRGGIYPALSVALATLTLVAIALYAGLDMQPRTYAHRSAAARFWLVCEKYRALLADIHDEALDPAAIKERRNALLQEVASLLEQGAPADRYTHEITRGALTGSSGDSASDALLDRYLPPSLRSASSASS